MEILRFDEEQAPRFRKRKSSIGWVLTGVVAVTLGLGSAFATTTITVNGNAPISLGQGVAATATCDNEIAVLPHATIDPTATVLDGAKPVFLFTSLSLGGVDTTAFTTSTGLGCGSRVFKIDFFTHASSNGALTPISCSDLVDSGAGLSFTVLSGDSSTHSASSDISCQTNSLYVTIPTTSYADNGLTISGLKLSPAAHPLDYITLVSQASVF